VALEVGYFYGLRKPVCLLQEKGLKTLPSDLIGKLYIKFDAQDIEGTIPDKITSWLIDKGLVLSTSLKSIKR
jgi:predicted nucleotide-binding protein